MRTGALWVDQIKDRDGSSICIYDLEFSSDGHFLMVAADNKIYVYDITDGSLIQTLKGHKDTVLCLSYAQDGKRFASGSADKQVIIWTSKMEGILKFSHNDAIRSVQYNPKSHQLLSCTSSDFGLWSPEQKTVTKNKATGQINCCAWNEDGTLFVLGLNSGVVSIRFKSGDEKMKFDRNGAVWGCFFFKNKDSMDMIALADWSRTLSFFDANGLQVQNDRNLTFDPLFMSQFENTPDNSFILVGGSNKKVMLFTLEGSYLDTISTQNSWVWVCKTHQNKMAIGCQDGSLSVQELSLMTVHSLYKDRYACRDSNCTDILIQHLLTGEKVRIKCRDLVKKIAVYDKTLAIQLPERVILYELSDDAGTTDMNYKVKEKISIKIECSLLVLCSSNLILCQEKRLQSLSFSGQLEKEWLFESPIRYIKTIGGVPRHESLLIDVIKLSHSIRCIDLNSKHQKIAVIDEKNKCFIYDLSTKKQLFEESNVTSIAWNANFEDLLCIAGPGFIGIKAEHLPIQIVNNQTFVIGYSGCKIFTLQQNTIITQKISYSKLLFQYLERDMINAAYRIACLNVTYEDWQALANLALSKSNLDVARKCLVILEDWHYLDLIETHRQTVGSAASSEQNEQMFLAKFYAYRGLFAEAAKLYKKIKAEHWAVEMFSDLQMYDQANDYRVQSSRITAVDSKIASTEETRKKSLGNLGDLQTMSQLYISNGEYNKAFQFIAASNIDSIMKFVGQLNKGETKMLSLIADYFISKDDFFHAIEVYQKMGDYKNLAQVYIRTNQWDDAFKIAHDFPNLKSDVYLPYALWLAENERFIEAQQAFLEAGQRSESYNVLNQLLLNSVNENRFNDAAYYSWLLANYFSQLSGDQGAEVEGNEISSGEDLRSKADSLYRQADIYYTYHPIYKYIEEPFTSVFVDVLFNSALFLFHYMDDEFPVGVSKVNILFALTKLGKNLGHYKLVRIAYKRLQALRLPNQLDELVEIGSIEIRTKPFIDAEDLASFCYRCSATNSLFSSKLNKCINCQQPFNQSFYSFDILPLVEFEVDPELTHDEIQLLLGKSSAARATSSERRNSVNWSEKREDFYSHDSLVTENDNDRFNILAANEHVNPNTNLIILGKAELTKLDLAHLVTITNQCRKDQSESQYRYFLNMMPEISIIACSHCSKFFYSDEYEFQILKNGKCPFCRN